MISGFIDKGLEVPKPFLAVILLLTIVFTCFFARHQHSNHIDIFFKPDDPRYLSYKKFQKIFGNEEFTVMIGLMLLIEFEKRRRVGKIQEISKQIYGNENSR